MTTDNMTADNTTTDNASHRFEFFAALLLGLTALLTGYATMRSAIVGDEVLEGFTLSSQHYNDANNLDDANTQTYLADQALFLRFAEARFAGDEQLTDYLRTSLFDERLATAVEWWETQQTAGNPPDSPFEVGSPYRLDDTTALEDQGDAAFEAAKKADERNDRFDQATAVLSITLFAVGLAVLVTAHRARLLMVALAIAGLCGGALLTLVGELG